MMNMKDIALKDLYDYDFFEGVNIIYGCGQNGEYLLGELLQAGIAVDYMYDDDHTRWDSEINGIHIISRDTFINICEKEKNVNVIIGSLYINIIYEKIVCMIQKDSLNVYTVTELMYKRDREILHIENYLNDANILKRMKNEKKLFNDKLSVQYLQLIINTLKGVQLNYLKAFQELYCNEPQYFLNMLQTWLNGKIIVDAGAYSGDTVEKIYELGIQPKAVYSFEADRHNYIRLLQRVNSLAHKNVTCFNCALWNKSEILYLQNTNFNVKVDKTANSNTNLCQALKIDDVFMNQHIDFIKMDIEGAEMQALKGGEQTFIRCRPLMAISIYHSINDICEIFEYLQSNLNNYKFFIRHHSITYSETILYCIPNETVGIIYG